MPEPTLAAAKQLERQHPGEPAGIVASAYLALVDIIAAIEANEHLDYVTVCVDLKRAEKRIAEEEKRADLHARINDSVAKALGQEFGETWHDLGEKVAALKRENAENRRWYDKDCDRERARVKKLKTALQSIAQYASDTLSGPTDPGLRPTWYRDGCRELERRAKEALDG